MTESVSKKPSGRPKRIPVGTRNRLEIINKEPGREYHLIDATPGRIQQFLDGGYRVETLEKHLPGSQRVESGSTTDNVLHVGGGQKQILVSIEKEYYEEDQKAKQRKVDESEAGLKNLSDGQYGKINISR